MDTRDAISTREEVDDYQARRYSKSLQRRVSSREDQIVGRLLAEQLPFETLLDAPSGYGRFSHQFVEAVPKLICSDISVNMLARTNEQLRAMVGDGKGADRGFVTADLTRLALADKSVDVSFCVRLFHHRPIPRIPVMAELARVTRKAVIVTFYRSGNYHRLHRKLMIKIGKAEYDLAFMPIEQFRAEAAEAGLRITKLVKARRFIHAQTFAVLAPE